MIQDILKQLNFTDNEAAVYLAILQQGKITPADLAKTTNVNRTTVYSIAKELIKRGLISEDLGGTTRYLIARAPQDLEQLVTREEKKLAQKKQLVSAAVKELQSYTKNAQYSIPKIVFVADDDVENQLYKRVKDWNDSIMERDGVWWGFQDQNLVANYEKWIDWYWQMSAPEGLSLKLISNKSAEELKEKKFPRRKIKFWPEGKDFTATTWICGDYVIMMVTQKRPHYMVEIHDAALAQNLRAMFAGIWKGIK